MARFLVSTPLALVVTIALFFLMQSMVGMRSGEMEPAVSGKVLGFVRLKRDVTAKPEDVDLPERPPDVEAPPEMDMGPLDNGGDSQVESTLSVAAPTSAIVPQLSAGPNLGTAVGDTDAIPLLRVEPQYPPAASQNGTEGWVRVRFAISRSGQVKNAMVVDSQPAVIFDEAALRAVRKWKYQPKVVDGRQVERHGLLVKLTFKLDKK